MKSSRLIAMLFVLVLLLVTVVPAAAITDGELDGEGHPFVGIMVGHDASGYWTCSGTLLSPTVFLTAGHCTDGADQIWIYFDANPVAADGHIYLSQADVQGTGYTHPKYAFPRYDVGVVVLDKKVRMSTYGVLPKENFLDAYETSKNTIYFTAVGYGMQQSFPDAADLNSVQIKNIHTYDRMVAYPKLDQINVPGFTGDYSILLSNNANTGGTCFGDSGGPNFFMDTNIVAGVTSFGINGNCAGTGGVYRMDRAEALNFVKKFLK